MKLISKRNLHEQAEVLGEMHQNEYTRAYIKRLRRLVLIIGVTFCLASGGIFYLFLKYTGFFSK